LKPPKLSLLILKLVVLVGPSGSGKTYLSAAIANERIRMGQPAYFQTVPDFLDHLRSAFAPAAKCSMTNFSKMSAICRF
jgi:DNA replication protein DnaC